MKDDSLYTYLTNLVNSEDRWAPNTVVRQKFDRAVYIYQPGDQQTCIHLIERGVVKIGSYSPDGERVAYDILQPGEFFGDLNYLDDTEFFEFAKAVTSVTVLSIDLRFFKHIIVHNPIASDWFNSNVVRRWWKAETRLLYMTRGDIDARLANLRKEYDKLVRDNEGKSHNVFNLLSLQVLADLTGTTRQTISKKLKEAVF
ncbi:Crp/Fnr family transcriptional regulator [Spirosoma aureum]|uniref:Crp/Fnr family transcriptional regulator n=1 Tax=Spirosoma aureum TaxID=2692134 RepID=A0A6G9AYI8_9BACT|nr:Crp/Fnr family transcriptional regulator [Spirosoma aureum]QIP17480.1 Crp/Fnr family transcriptional regulator [Spirosoma aureum]